MKTLKLTSSKQDILKTNADAAAMRVFMLLVLMLLCCSGMFGQQSPAQETEIPVAISNVTDGHADKAEAVDANRQFELVQWFMGSKQMNNPAAQPARTSPKAETAKKVLINCGMTPNRILSRTLLKKAMQYENNIA
ncbi:hypothetical protein [Flavobacterium selenitireducens]|uniref:hypothetical protein n=1 Tax=Flavobacterium selenitireducens TaxID=2722704 RepID=UPI00168A44FE|nr:hypothetical protein [Flavobacterium selenitireducens]MBD3582701.1 hypothetical protein [Flavobacterium selenitireducens]